MTKYRIRIHAHKSWNITDIHHLITKIKIQASSQQVAWKLLPYWFSWEPMTESQRNFKCPFLSLKLFKHKKECDAGFLVGHLRAHLPTRNVITVPKFLKTAFPSRLSLYTWGLFFFFFQFKMNSSRIYLKPTVRQIRPDTEVPIPCCPGSRITTLLGCEMFPLFSWLFHSTRNNALSITVFSNLKTGVMSY